MNSLHETAYCGIYCPDCIRYQNKYDEYARKLRNELENVEFRKYAEINSPFGANFKKYNEFIEVLNALPRYVQIFGDTSNPSRLS
ncbi:MAG: hypothetical protein PF482_11365 [Desulfobacteraceae bacterium]|jgi:thiol-disulfide isomerase/thioredoxin|nr:hypothetical protein [Desulfobacteraceae bacterium]